MARVAVIGAGVGGLATAIRLADAGYEVSVYEQNDAPGGKLTSRTIDGFTFDIGPSLLTMPEAFDELGVEFSRTRLEQPFRYTFADGSNLAISDDLATTAAAFDDLSDGEGDAWRKLLDHGQRIWEISERTFFSGPMSSPVSLLKRMKSPADFTGIDALRTLHQRSTRLFTDARAQQWLDRYATYSGSSPFAAPATLSCIPYLEQRFGCWTVPGGLATISIALAKRAIEVGVSINYNSPVGAIDKNHDNVTGITLVSGDRIQSDKVVANVDSDVLYSQLLPMQSEQKRLARAPKSTAGFAMLLGLNGVTPNLQHHNVWFSPDYKQEFSEITAKGVATDPTIYVCCSGDAPNGSENWFVLVNVRAGSETNWAEYGNRIIDRLGVRDRIVVREDLSPQFFAQRYGNPGGAIYGTSSDGRRAAFLRSNNRGAVEGLYLVGGSAHPGGGLPLVTRSAKIVTQMIQQDGQR